MKPEVKFWLNEYKENNPKYKNYSYSDMYYSLKRKNLVPDDYNDEKLNEKSNTYDVKKRRGWTSKEISR